MGDPALLREEFERLRSQLECARRRIITWKDGPPPVADDGSCVLVILRPNCGHEHYGKPAVVTRWASKLKTTVDAVRLDYDDVLRWAEVPT